MTIQGKGRETGYEANNYLCPYVRIVRELNSGKSDLTIMILICVPFIWSRMI
jgi:hypothetical protein